jgi:hypothetical protein
MSLKAPIPLKRFKQTDRVKLFHGTPEPQFGLVLGVEGSHVKIRWDNGRVGYYWDHDQVPENARLVKVEAAS